MSRSIALVTIAASAAMLPACGTTSIVTTDPTAHILVDGEVVGRGQAQIRQRGLPSSAQIVVKTNDGREQRTQASRSFTGVTFLLGMISYGVCWVACWEYPNVVFVDLPDPSRGYALATPGTPGVDPWLAPPPGWQSKKVPSRTEQSNTGQSDTPAGASPTRPGVSAPSSED